MSPEQTHAEFLHMFETGGRRLDGCGPAPPKDDRRHNGSDGRRCDDRQKLFPDRSRANGWRRRYHAGTIEGAIEHEPGIADVANAVRSILVKAATEQRRDREREAGRKRRPVGITCQHSREHVGDLVTVEGAPRGQHVVEHGAERPDVTWASASEVTSPRLSAYLLRKSPGLCRSRPSPRLVASQFSEFLC
jgi:hypothetical protein